MERSTSFFGTYTSGAESWFKCLSCGQDHTADGDYLEYNYATGGDGVLIAKTNNTVRPRARQLFSTSRENDITYVVYQLSECERVNTALASKLAMQSAWTVRISFDRRSARAIPARRYDLENVSRKFEVINGCPPSMIEIMELILADWHTSPFDDGENPETADSHDGVAPSPAAISAN